MKTFTVDEVIGFAAIPIDQVVNAQGGSLYGTFDIFEINGKIAGELYLQLAVQGLPNSPQAQVSDYQQDQPVRGLSYANDVHVQRIKSLRNKVLATDVGMSALAVGAGLLGAKMLHDHHKGRGST